MKIAQLVVNNSPNTSYRYATELNKQLNNLDDITAEILLLEQFEFNDDTCKLLNSYDFCFIHSLPKNPNVYSILVNKITIKKILFITDINIKQWHNSISISKIGNLLRASSNIVINELATDIINEIIHIISKTAFDEKFVQLKYIYKFTEFSIEDLNNKKYEISLISNKGLRANYELFINMFEHRRTLDLLWNIYGVTKNIQTMSVNNLYINRETNQKSLLTNFSRNPEKTKINVYEPIGETECNQIISNNLFIANFDITNILSYTLLDIIGHGTIPILDKNVAKNIKVNKSQSLYDVNCGIFIDSKTLDDEFIVQINKLLSSKNSYLQLLNRIIKIFNKIFNTEETINELLINLQIK